MIKRSTVFFLCWLLITLKNEGLQAQSAPPSTTASCATVDLTPAQALSLVQQGQLALERKKASGTAFTAITYVPIRPHIVRAANGQGGTSLATINYALAKTNSYYLLNGSGIQFYFAGTEPDYIDNDLLYSSFPYPEGSSVDGRDAPNAMNQYYINRFERFDIGGYAYYPFDGLYSTRSFVLPDGGRIMPHELGHNFNLIHTFGQRAGTGPAGSGTTGELVTRGVGANCTTQGDLICDTPADPYNMSGAIVVKVNGCDDHYDANSTARDAHGDAYNPLINNLMSYYFPCTQAFTPGQYDRMQEGLALRQTHTSYSLNSPATAMSAPTNVMARLINSVVTLTWQDNSSNEMGYFIERSTSPTAGFLPIGGVGPNETSYRDDVIQLGTHYYYRIRPSNTTTGSLSPTADIQTPSSNGPITGLTTSNITPTDAQLSWTSAGDNITYDVQWRQAGSSDWITLSHLIQPTATLTSLPSYTSFEWRVKATDQNTYTAPVQFTTLCPTPIYLSSIPARVSASLSWYSSYENATYTLQWRPQGAPAWTTVNSLTTKFYSLTGLTASTPYEWQVQGVCSATASTAFTNQQSFTTLACQAIGYSYSSNIRSSSASISWTISYVDSQRTFDLRYRPVGTAIWTTVSSLTATTYTLTGLTNNTQYEFQVRSVCSAAEITEYSPVNTFTTFCALTPIGPTINPSATTASIYWGFAGLPESGSTYELQYRPLGSTDWITLTGPSSGSYGSRTVTGLASNTTYECRVRTVCSLNAYSGFSSTVTFTTGCFAPAPGNLYVNSVLSSSATLTFGQYSDPGTTFDLRYRPVGNPTWTTVSSLTTSNSTINYSLSGLANNTQYEWQVRMVCSPTASTSFTPGPVFTTKCLIPSTNYPLVQVTSASLIWNPTETGASYDVRYRPVGATDWVTVSNLTSTTAVVSGLTGNSSYEWQVRARCSDGSYSDFSYSGTFRTVGCTVPYYLFASTNVTSARLNWSFGSANADTRYEILYRIVGDMNWTILSNLTSNNFVGYADLAGLTPSTQYEWLIRTICSATESSDFTPGPDFVTRCFVPTNLYANTTLTSATLLWGQAGFGVNYEARYRLAGTTNWTTVSNLASTSLAIAGLSINTTYEWQVKTLCSNAITSDFSEVRIFTTAACSSPYSLTTTNLTTTSAQLNWGYPLANADTRYEGRYRAVGASNWITLSNLSSDNYVGYFVITGLASNTQYEWQIKTICSPTESSGFTASVTFQTVNPCPSMYTVKAGLWNDASVWSCNRVPISSDIVQIKHAVTIPGSFVAVAKRLIVDTGQKLIYSPSAQLKPGF